MKKTDAQRSLPFHTLDPQTASGDTYTPHAPVDSAEELDPVCTLEFVCHSEHLNHMIRAARRH